MYSVDWKLAEVKQDKGVKVFSCFCCGGGSSMGYKRAGFEVLGGVEIDPQMAKLYEKNQKPKYLYVEDLRDFNDREDLPDEIHGIDILDGSPPCSTFSMAGHREKSWGKKKKFREGQKEQTLDDLFFVFLDTVERLKPKVVVAENVKGIIAGNAKGYCREVISRFKGLGYDVQVFLLNAAEMNVPQRRERVFFVANRCGFPALRLDFNERPIPFGEIRSEEGRPVKEGKTARLLKEAKHGEKNFLLWRRDSQGRPLPVIFPLRLQMTSLWSRQSRAAGITIASLTRRHSRTKTSGSARRSRRTMTSVEGMSTMCVA